MDSKSLCSVMAEQSIPNSAAKKSRLLDYRLVGTNYYYLLLLIYNVGCYS